MMSQAVTIPDPISYHKDLIENPGILQALINLDVKT